MKEYKFRSIGKISSQYDSKYQAPRQANITQTRQLSKIELFDWVEAHFSLRELDGVERIFIFYIFDRSTNWKPIVNPPRGNKKVGVFASRSPYRPNPIGMSICKIVEVDSNYIIVENADLLDNTPIIDIKPYIPEYDSFPESRVGWIDELEKHSYDFVISEKVSKIYNLLKDFSAEMNIEGFDYFNTILDLLNANPYPKKYRRIKKLDENKYQIAIKSWRFEYIISENKIEICDFYSGYTKSQINNNVENNDSIHQFYLHQKYWDLVQN